MIRQRSIALAVLTLFVPSLPCFPRDSEPEINGAASATNTSVCELVAQPARFNGKVVRIEALYESDGRALRILVDRRCPNDGGIVPSGQAHDRPVGDVLINALQQGCAGTLDKEISAVWTGIFHWEPENRPATGKVPRWLDVQKIEGLEVRQKPDGPKCATPR